MSDIRTTPSPDKAKEVLDWLIPVLPHIRNGFQLIGSIILIVAVVGIQLFRPENFLAQVCAGAVGGSVVLFSRLLPHVGALEPHSRLRYLIGIALVFCGFVLVLVVVTDRLLSEPRTRPSGSVVMLNFDEIPTALPPFYAPADVYLAKYGIKLNTTNGKVVAVRADRSYGGGAFTAMSAPNVLTEGDCTAAPASFTLTFSAPVIRVSFYRAALLSTTDNGITHPAWAARAFDGSGRQLAAVDENMIRSLAPVAAARFELNGPGIAKIEFESDNRLDGKPFTAFCSVLLDDFVFSR